MRNWTIREAVEVINAGTDKEAIREIAKHFPEFFMAVVKQDIVGLAQMMGEKFTVRRLAVVDTDAEPETETDAPAPKKAPAKAKASEVEVADDGDLDYNAMTTKELIALCGTRGIKVPKYGKAKQFYIDALTNVGGEAEGEPEAETEAGGYETMSALDLYKLCKSRKLKAEQKRSPKYYIGILEKADKEAAAEAEAEDEDWGDAEEETPAPKAKADKKAKSTPKAKPAEPEEDDDDGDWDI